MALLLFAVGLVLAVGSYFARSDPPWDSLLIETASNLLLIVLLEVLLRRALLAARVTEAEIAQIVTEAREQAVSSALEFVADKLDATTPEDYVEAWTKQILGEEWEPGIPMGVCEDHKWEDLWKTQGSEENQPKTASAASTKLPIDEAKSRDTHGRH